MPIITLTSDWKPNDIYPGMLRGRILQHCPDAVLVDNALGLAPFNSTQAAFVVRNTFHHYPEGSIHLLAVQTQEPFLLARSKNHYFIGPDNGMLYLILSGRAEEIIRLEESKIKHPSFKALEIFPKVIKGLLDGLKLQELGKPAGEIVERIPIRPTLEEKAISGSVVFVDTYENAITNISRELFTKSVKNRPFEIVVQSNLFKINTISKRYNEVPVGEMVALFNSLDLLEIAMNSGNAAGLLSLRPGSAVRINFTEP